MPSTSDANAAVPRSAPGQDRVQLWRRRLGVALLTAAALVLEIALTRVLSVIHYYAYVYVLLSVAVLGIGLGAGLASWRPFWRAPGRLSLWAALAGLAGLLLTALTVSGAGSSLAVLPLLLAALPYLFVGLALSTAFGSAAADSPRLYWADLSGAGLGALLCVPLMNLLGGPGSMLAAVLLFGLAGLLFAARPAPRGALVAGLVVLTAAPLGLWPGALELDLERLAPSKPVASQLRAGAETVATDWSAFARTDLLYRPDQNAYYVYVDGAAGSLVPGPADAEVWRRDIGTFPFAADRPDSALVIGPGGGLDIALAQSAGTRDIVAVEINRSSVELVRGLGNQVYGETVELHVDEGRSVLRRLDRNFDLIFLSQVVTQAAEARGYALTENSLYTTEAFHDYLDHLSPGGQLALKLYDELTLTRALTTGLTALKGRGLSEAEASRHLLALLDTRASPPVPLLLVRKQPIDPAEAVRLARQAERLELALLYVPGLLARPPLAGLASGQTTLAEIVEGSRGADIRPTTDDWPFFYQFQPGLPDRLRSLLYGLAALLALTVAGLTVTLRGERQPLVRWAPWLFAALGFGFMAVEVSLLQRAQLFLGHPTLTLSVVLGTLLLVGGLGSALASRVSPAHDLEAVAWSGLLVALLLTAWTLLWPLLSAALRGGSPSLRVVVTVASLSPLALAMGLPFPLALRRLGRHGARHVALAWAVNGVMSVAGGVGATALALLLGFDSVSLAGGLAYAAVAVLGLALSLAFRIGKVSSRAM